MSKDKKNKGKKGRGGEKEPRQKMMYYEPKKGATAPLIKKYWVEPGKVMAGEYPGAFCRKDAAKKIAHLLDEGCRYFIDLTEAYERKMNGVVILPYQQILEEVAEEKGVTVAYKRMPIVDVSIPEVSEMEEILIEIHMALYRKMPVYVHCRGGVGRTGTVVGCYLAEQGHVKPLDKIQDLKFGSGIFAYSPETWCQEKFVERWGTPGLSAKAIREEKAQELRSHRDDTRTRCFQGWGPGSSPKGLSYFSWELPDDDAPTVDAYHPSMEPYLQEGLSIVDGPLEMEEEEWCIKGVDDTPPLEYNKGSDDEYIDVPLNGGVSRRSSFQSVYALFQDML